MTLAELPQRWTAEQAANDHDCGPGWLVEDTKFDTLHHITEEAFDKLDVNALAAVTAQGRDVDHITRVTGYFSKTSGWNPSKVGELKDRHRTGL